MTKNQSCRQGFGHPLCPVASFEKYLSKLHHNHDALWQRPKDTYLETDTLWYCNARVGSKSLSTFLSDVSTACELSQIYTNHSLRTTGCTLLSKSGFNHAQICSVTGHKSVQSLAVYQRVEQDEKVIMGQAIASNLIPTPVTQPSLTAPPRQLALPAPYAAGSAAQLLQVAPVPAPGPNHVEMHMSGVELDELFGDVGDTAPNRLLRNITNLSHQSLASQMPLFHGCKIGTINININT
jgi:hypothetical protein